MVKIPTRYWKWDNARDWSEKFRSFFSYMFGLGFDEDAIEPVNNACMDFCANGSRIKIHMKSGSKILRGYTCLDPFISIAGMSVIKKCR